MGILWAATRMLMKRIASTTAATASTIPSASDKRLAELRRIYPSWEDGLVPWRPQRLDVRISTVKAAQTEHESEQQPFAAVRLKEIWQDG